MPLPPFWTRWSGRCQRMAAAMFARRPFVLKNREPLISFTFDDFPRSALSIAGRILENHGVFGTYYTSLGLMGQTAPTGEMFIRDDLLLALQRGHELGCHTFGHCHAFDTSAGAFEQSVLQNRSMLASIAPEAKFKTLSYPIGCPRPATKRRSGRYFRGCRAGGQTFNVGTVDINLLRAFFIEQSRDRPASIKTMIDANMRACGWLIFATHDVCENPTRFGCHPEIFAQIVRYSAQSGTRMLPVSEALTAIGVTSDEPK